MRIYDVIKSDDGKQLTIKKNSSKGARFEKTIDIASIHFIDGYGLIAINADTLHNNIPTYIVGVINQNCDVVLAPEDGVLGYALLRNGNIIISAVDPARGMFDTTEIHYTLSGDGPKMHDLQRDKDGNRRPCTWELCPDASYLLLLRKPYSNEIIGYYEIDLANYHGLENDDLVEPDAKPTGSYVL